MHAPWSSRPSHKMVQTLFSLNGFSLTGKMSASSRMLDSQYATMSPRVLDRGSLFALTCVLSRSTSLTHLFTVSACWVLKGIFALWDYVTQEGTTYSQVTRRFTTTSTWTKSVVLSAIRNTFSQATCVHLVMCGTAYKSRLEMRCQ